MEKHKIVTYVTILMLVLGAVGLANCATQKVRGKLEAETYPSNEAPVLDSRILTDKVVA